MSILNFNQLKSNRVAQNFSTFTGGNVAGVTYTRPTQYIQAYLGSAFATNGVVDFDSARKHFIDCGITKATVMTQCNLFKRNMLEKGVDSVVKITKPLKTITDLNNWHLVALLDGAGNAIQVFDNKLYDNDKIIKVAIQINDKALIITE